MLYLALTVVLSTLVAAPFAQRDQLYDNSGYVPPYYDYYGNGYVLYTCAVPTDKPVYHCAPGGGTLLITPSLAALGGPDGTDPPSGYIEMSNVTYGWECAVDIQPAKVPGVNVRVRANCVSPITSNDTVTMDGSEGATGGLSGGVSDPTRFVTMGSEASLLYKAGAAPPIKGQDCVAIKDKKGKKKKGKKDNCGCEDEEDTTCDCQQKKGGVFAKIGALFRKRKPACDCIDGSGVKVDKKKKKKKGKCGKKDNGNKQGRRLLFDGATGGLDAKLNDTVISLPPTILSYAAILEYDVIPGCTPVDYSEKARRCYGSNSVSDPIKVYTSPNSKGKLTAEGPWASDCSYAFTVPTGYYVELTLGCLAAGIGNITITPTVGNESALTIGTFGEFLSCYSKEGGCTFEDEAPIVRFQLGSSPWLTSMQQGYYYYDSYWLTTFSIDYEVKPIPGANITQGPDFQCPAPPPGAVVYTCANDVWTVGYDNITYPSYDPYRGSYYFAYLSAGDEGYIYMPSYSAYQSCSSYLQASTADYEGTIDLEVICLDTEPDYDYLSFYGGGQYAALSGRVENSTYKDLGSLLSMSFYADASVQGAGFLLKYKVRSSNRCPSPAYGYRTQTYTCDANWYMPSNATVVPVTLAAKSKGQFVVPQNAPPNCTFDIESVPRGYELQVETSCVAASTGTLTVYGRDGSNKGVFGDTSYKTCSDQCTIVGLKSGASLQFLSNYGGLQNISYFYPYSYYYSYSEYNKTDDGYYEDGHAISDERHFDKVHRRRAQQWGYAYNDTGYFYWYVSYSNAYPYWTPQMVVEYQLVRTNDPTDPADPPVNECVGDIIQVPAGADVLDLTPVEAVADNNVTNYRRRSLRAPEGPAAMGRHRLHRIDRRGLQESNYTDYQPTYEPYVSKYPGYVYASIPVVIDQPLDPDTAPSGYLQVSSYGPNTYVTASLYMVSSNWMQPLGNDTNFEFDVVCLDTEEGVDYLSIVGYGNQWSYDSYSRNYITLSGSHTGATYENFGQNAYLSFYSDDSIEGTGFLIRWRVVQNTGTRPSGGAGTNGPKTAGPDPKPDFRALGGPLGPTTAFVEEAEGANVGLKPSEPWPIHDD